MRLMVTIIPKNGIKLFVFGIKSVLQIIAVTLQNNSEINCRFFALIFFPEIIQISQIWNFYSTDTMKFLLNCQ